MAPITGTTVLHFRALDPDDPWVRPAKRLIATSSAFCVTFGVLGNTTAYAEYTLQVSVAVRCYSGVLPA